MKIEIVRDFDGSYYVNGLSLPEYVSYFTLKQEAKKQGYILPNVSELSFIKYGRKSYAHIEI